MRVLVVGLGNQGTKRVAAAGKDLVATVDPVVSSADYKTVDQVPVDRYDAALICTPDKSKIDILTYLLQRGKHVLVEKPLLATEDGQIPLLRETARSTGAVCYTAYNHRYEPHILRLKEDLDRETLGRVYLAKFFYGNGTALDIKRSPWRDEGLGVLSDLGSHLLDLAVFLLGSTNTTFEAWSLNKFETRSFDYALFGCGGDPVLQLEATYLSWRNTFTIDVFGESGSAHVHGLCKWGPSRYVLRKRVYPSGVPQEETETIEQPDPTWAADYQHFKKLCQTGGTALENDQWINSALNDVANTTVVPCV